MKGAFGIKRLSWIIQTSKRNWEEGSMSQRLGTDVLQALERIKDQGVRVSLEDKRGKATNPPPELSEGTQPCPQLDFALTSGFRLPRTGKEMNVCCFGPH